MHIAYQFTPEVTIIVSVFALAWLSIGIVLGRMLRFRANGHDSGGEDRRSRRNRGARRRNNGDVVELYVGNLSYDLSEKELNKTFQQYGEVVSARIIKHRFSGQSKGFGFVEMADRGEAEAAINALHNKEMKGRKLVVNEAKSRSRDD